MQGEAVRTNRTAKMGTTPQNDEKLKFNKGTDEGTTRENQGEIFQDSAARDE